MPHVPISDLKPGMSVRQFFLLRRLEQRTTTRGDPYLNLLLSDRTGSIAGKVWSDSLPEPDKGVHDGMIVGIQGHVEQYQDTAQINVKFIASVDYLKKRGSDLKELELDDLLPRTPFDVDEMWTALIELVQNEVREPVLRELTLAVLTGNEELFREAPAALIYHHAYRGGLLEHTWHLARSVLALAEVEQGLDRDVLLAGAVLHDVGKIAEIRGTGAFEHSTQGRLLGHLILGRDLVRGKARELGLDENNLDVLHLEHIILSHHGELAFGSPVVPKTLEAFVIHMMDDLNAKLKMIREHTESHKGEELFTDYHRVLARSFLVTPTRDESGETD